MTAAAASRATTQRVGQTRYLLLATSALLFAGCMVCRNASGAAVDGSDAANLSFAGIARTDADEASGDDGVEVFVDGEFLLVAEGLAAGDEGKVAYLLDNQTVGLASNAGVGNFIAVGRIVQVVSATSAWVRIDPDIKAAPQTLTVEVAGTNAAALDFTTVAAAAGGSDFYVRAVLHVAAFVTATGASAGRKVVTTNFTLSGGVVTVVGNETANTWAITFIGVLQ